MPRRVRNFIRNALTALCVAALLIPAAAMAAPPEERLDEVETELDEARGQLDEVQRERTVTLADLEQIDAELAVLNAELAEVEAALAEAQAELADAEEQLETTTRKITATQAQLDDRERELSENRRIFRNRTRNAYMFASPVQGIGLLDAGDAADFSRRIGYVSTVLGKDRDRVEHISGLVRLTANDAEQLEYLRERQAEERAAAEADRDAVAVAVAEAEAVRNTVDAEREKRRVVLVQLESDAATYETMIAELESESQAIEEELRRIAEEEARRAAAAAAAAEAEAQRIAEEEARREAEGSDQAGSATTASGGEPPTAVATTSGAMQRPTGGRISSNYGWRTHPITGTRRFHAGTDFAPGYGAPIVAAQSGTVVSAGNRGGYGLTVVIDHGGGLATLYAHQSSFAVSSGQSVERGQVIGYVGSTGFSTGPHLHFEVRVNGATRNPMDYL